MKQASPAATPGAPTERPGKTVPSSRTRWRGHGSHTTHDVCIIRTMFVTTAILGASGYSGQETLDRVLAHPELELVALGSDSLAGRPAAALDPRLGGRRAGVRRRTTRRSPPARELVFCCLDHERAAALEPPAGAVVVDLSRRAPARRARPLSGLVRLRAPARRRRSATGSTRLPELFPPDGPLIANPGCYATAALLALAPLAAAIDPAAASSSTRSRASRARGGR